MHDKLSAADYALGRLDGAVLTLPNPDLFVFLYEPRLDTASGAARLHAKLMQAVREWLGILMPAKTRLLARLESINANLAQLCTRGSSLLVSIMDLGILFIGTDLRVNYHNQAFTHIWRIGDDTSVAGQPIKDVFSNILDKLQHPSHFLDHVQNLLDAPDTQRIHEINMLDGRLVTLDNHPIKDKTGRITGQLWIFEDITSKRQTAVKLAYLSERDPLTRLYNRRYFDHALKRVINECDRHREQAALLLLDIDDFEVINANFNICDAMLERIASELILLTPYNGILCRVGVDEFALLLLNTNESGACHTAKLIVNAVSSISFRYERTNVRITCSMGIALYPYHALDAEPLMARAYVALYQAKKDGKNTWRMYCANQDVAHSTDLSFDLKQAHRLHSA